MPASRLIINTLQAIERSAADGPVLDMACGNGRNGIYLINQGVPVTFADHQQDKIDTLRQALADNALATYWTVDLEEPGGNPLAGRTFSSVLVFRYLHRPLMQAIKDAIQPGGLIVYETYTVDQPRFGRPTNPDFLLRSGELQETFCSWEILYQFEGMTHSESSGREQAIAQIIARKPCE